MPPSESSDGGIFMEMAGNGGYRPADRVAKTTPFKVRVTRLQPMILNAKPLYWIFKKSL